MKGSSDKNGSNKYKTNVKMNVTRIANALKVKYKNIFTVANYNDTTLLKDIETLLNTKYKTASPKEVFKPIEEEILNIIRQQQQNTSSLPSSSLRKSKSKQRNIKHKASPSQTKTEIVTDNTSTLVEAEKPLQQVITPIQTQPVNDIEYGDEPHELRDKLKMRMEYDYMAKYLKEQNEKFEEAERAKHNAKVVEQKKMYEFLQQQINERKLLLKQQHDEDKKLKQLQDENYIKYIENEKLQHKMKQKLQLELQTNFKLQQQQLKSLQKQTEANRPLYTLNPRGYFNDDTSRERQEQFRKQFIKDCETYRNEREAFIAKQKEMQVKEEERFIRQCDEMANKKLNDESEFIKRRIAERMKQQEIAEEHLRNLYLKKNKSTGVIDKYIQEKEEQDKRKQKEYELADMKRKEKINLMLKSFDAHILNKELEKQKQRDMNKHIREKEQQKYNAYITEINEQRRHKEEVLRKYREDLRKQIEENKQRAIDDYKRSFGIIPETLSSSLPKATEDDTLSS